MKVLSVRQPWAWAIVNGFKQVENRGRRIHYRGEFLVHASLNFDRKGLEFIRSGIGVPTPETFDCGGIVGQSTIIGCVNEGSKYGGWFTGPWGWLLTDSKPLPFFEVKGKLGLWELAWPQQEAG